MEELIRLYKNTIIFYDCSELNIMHKRLSQMYEYLKPLNYNNHNYREIINTLREIDYYDIGNILLFSFYRMRVKESDQRTALFFEFIKTPKITETDKETYIRYLNDKAIYKKSSIDLKVIHAIELKLSEVFKLRKRCIKNNLVYLAQEKEFYYLYNYFHNISRVRRYKLTEEELPKCIDNILHTDRLSRLTPKELYIKAYFRMNERFLDGLGDDIQLLDANIKRKTDITEKNNQMFMKNKRKIEDIFAKDLITEQSIQILQNILKNEYLFNKALLLVLEHNNNYMKDKINTIDPLEEELRSLFKNYGYDHLSEKLKEKLHNKEIYPKIKETIATLTKNKIEIFLENLEVVLLNARRESIDFLGNLLYRDYIDNTFINKNIPLLIDEKIFVEFLNKINALLENNLDVKSVLTSIDIMKISEEDLIGQIHMLRIYRVDIEKKNLHNYEFLTDETVLDKIDLFLEENLEVIIRNHPEYLNQNMYNVPKRIHINHMISTPVRNSEKTKLLPSVLYEKYYFLKDKYLDKFLCSHTDEYLDIYLKEVLKSSKRNTIDKNIIEDRKVRLLDEKFLNGENYLFESITISRLKFLRNYTVLKECSDYNTKDLVYNALIYNSYLLHDELLIIKENIENIYKELDQKKYYK